MGLNADPTELGVNAVQALCFCWTWGHKAIIGFLMLGGRGALFPKKWCLVVNVHRLKMHLLSSTSYQT